MFIIMHKTYYVLMYVKIILTFNIPFINIFTLRERQGMLYHEFKILIFTYQYSSNAFNFCVLRQIEIT